MYKKFHLPENCLPKWVNNAGYSLADDMLKCTVYLCLHNTAFYVLLSPRTVLANILKPILIFSTVFENSSSRVGEVQNYIFNFFFFLGGGGGGGRQVGSIIMQCRDVGQGSQAHKTTGYSFSKIRDGSKSNEGIKSILLFYKLKVKGY